MAIKTMLWTTSLKSTKAALKKVKSNQIFKSQKHKPTLLIKLINDTTYESTVRVAGGLPGPPHGVFDMGDGAVVQHDVSRDVQGHQVDEALGDGRQDLPGHFELGRAPALPGNVQMPGERMDEMLSSQYIYVYIYSDLFLSRWAFRLRIVTLNVISNT